MSAAAAPREHAAWQADVPAPAGQEAMAPGSRDPGPRPDTPATLAPTGPAASADPVFGHLASPDTVDTKPNDEVLQLFDEPAARSYSPSALPPLGPVSGSVSTGGVPGGGRSGAAGSLARGRRYGLLAGAGAGAVVVVAAGVAAAFFSSGSGADEPTGAGNGVSAADTSSPTATEDGGEQAGRHAERPATSASGSASASASPTTASASPATGSAEPARRTRTSAPPSGDEEPRVLSRGDTGAQVVELQQRLQQLRLFVGSANGRYSPHTEEAVTRFQQARRIDEEPGVYGPRTRAAVEAETSDPS